jgi:transcription elongation GreA/GreB family factor
MERKIIPGSTVTVLREDGRNFCFVLVPPVEANINEGRLSVAAPLGRALLGREPGEEFTFDAPGGRVKMTILDVLPVGD